jgi:predicted lipid-binding transport protein (Tim44 family)
MSKVRWLALVLASVSMLVPVLADARAGSGGSFGSRGTRTYQAPRPTAVAPAAKPMDRSATPPQPAQQPATAAPAPAQAPSGGFLARNPFLSGVMGGVLGAGLMGMMFGGGFSGGSLGGMGSTLLQLMIIGGLIYLALRMLRGKRSEEAQSDHAAYGFVDRTATVPEAQRAPVSFQQLNAAAPASGNMPLLAGRPAEEVRITDTDFSAFEALLAEVQAAYSKGDLAKMRGLASPEMVGYFSEALSANVSRGLENKVEAVKLEQGDLSEAWSEAGLDYASVAMRFSMTDVTRNIADGTIVDGSDSERSEATEVWTFLRSRGGKWIVSAIQQS